MAQAAATEKQNRNNPQLILASIWKGGGLDELASEVMRRTKERTNSLQSYDNEVRMREGILRLLSQGLQAAVLALADEPGGLEDAANLLARAAKDGSGLKCGSVVSILLPRHMNAKQPHKVLEVAWSLCNAANRSSA